jgi:hypothetical protein
MRGKIAVATILALSLAALPWPAAVGAEERGAVQVVETEGFAVVIGQNRAQARSEAVRMALQNAVETVTTRWLLPLQYSSPDRVPREQLLDRAELYILDFRILSESVTSELYSVTVRVTVSGQGIRRDLQRLGLAEPGGPDEAAVTRIVLRVLGIRDYGDYLRCQSVLERQIPGLRHVTLREASWGVVRFDIDAEGSAESLGVRLRETTAFEILHQDTRLLEVNLR